MQPQPPRDVWRAMRLAIGAIGVCLGVVSALAACAPRWIQPEFREEVKDRAIATAMKDYACPRDQISVRCDASSSTQILDGRMVAYDDDGVIGTYVTELPSWEVELAVCGHLRRYRYKQPELPTAFEVAYIGKRQRASMVEVRRGCGGAYCLGAEPDCTNCGREHWWPVDTMPTSDLCANAVDDGSITVEVVENSVEVVLVVDQPRELSRRCGDSPLFVTIDGTWFSLCGDGVAHMRPGVHRIPTGITLGVNFDGGREHLVEAFDARADRCRRSLPLRAVLPRTKLSWEDIITVTREIDDVP